MQYAPKLLLFCLLVVIYSCKEEDDPLEAQPVTAADVTGDWEIARFVAGGENIAGQFGQDVVMEVSTNADVFFRNSPQAVYGSWSVEDNELSIRLVNAAPPYGEFHDDWTVVSKSENQIELIDSDYFGDDADEGDEDLDDNDEDGDTGERVTLVRVEE